MKSTFLIRSLDLELGYAYIPTEDIVEHELTAALGGVYHF